VNAAPPKPTLAQVVAGEVSTALGGKAPEPNDTWNTLMGVLGYWLPNSLNRSASYRAAIRALR